MRAPATRTVQRLSPLALLALWEAAVRLGLLDGRLFPPPSAVARAAWEMTAGGDLGVAVAVSLARMAAGFLAGALPAVVLGLVMGLAPVVRAALEPLVYALYPLPKLALLPLVIILLGLGEASKVAIVALGVFFPVLISTAAGVMGIARVHRDVARAFGARPLDFYLTVALPGALPGIVTGVRLGAGMALLLIVAAEMIAAQAGLGYLIWTSYQTFELEKMFLAFAVIAFLGWLQSLGLARLERTLLPWLPGVGER